MSNPKKKTPSVLNQAIEESMNAGGTLFGGAAYGGSGTFSYTQTAGAKTWSPRSPISRATTSDPQGFNVKDIGDDEHIKAQAAGDHLPYPIDQVSDHLAQAFIHMSHVESLIKTCLKYNTVMSHRLDKKALLSHLHKKSKALKLMAQNMSSDLDKLTLQ